MKGNELSKDPTAEDIIDWARHNYYSKSEECRYLLNRLDSQDTHIEANKYNILGILDMYDSEYYKSQNNFTKALQLAKKKNDSGLIAKIYLNLTSLSERLENYPEALQYASKVFSTGQSRIYGSTYYNLARINFTQGNIEMANKYLKDSINAYNKYNDPAVFHGYFLRSEILKESGKFEEALESYKFVLEFLKTTTFYSFRASTLNEIGHTYLSLGKAKEGIPYIKEGIAEAIKYNIVRDKFLGHLRLAECYSALKNYKKADESLDIYLNDKTGTGIYYRIAHELRIKNYKESNDNRLSSAYDQYIAYLTKIEFDNTRKVHLQYLKLKQTEIEDIKNKAEAIQNQNEELKYISKLLAHDLKTPVRTIGSFNSLLNNANVEYYNDESKEFSEFISNGTKEIYTKLDLTEKYLNLKINNSSQGVFLNKLIEKINSKYFNDAIKLTISGDIKIISADKQLLKTAFNILFQNFKSLSKSKPISLSINCDNELKQLTISDNEGLSIKEANWKRNIFNTVDEEISEGLSFFTKIIKLHKGKLEINEKEKSLIIKFEYQGT